MRYGLSSREEKKFKIDPYADWEIEYQREIHRADGWLDMDVPIEDRVGDTLGQNWIGLNRKGNEVEDE